MVSSATDLGSDAGNSTAGEMPKEDSAIARSALEIAHENMSFFCSQIASLEEENSRLRKDITSLMALVGIRSLNKEEMAWAVRRATELGILSPAKPSQGVGYDHLSGPTFPPGRSQRHE